MMKRTTIEWIESETGCSSILRSNVELADNDGESTICVASIDTKSRTAVAREQHPSARSDGGAYNWRG